MPRRVWFWLGLLTLLGAGLRFYRLNELPPGLFGDEALASLHARNLLTSPHFPIYFAQVDGGFHPAIIYLTLLTRWVTNNHIYAIRLGVAAVGAGTLPLIFFALRSIFQLDEARAARANALGLMGAFIYTSAFPDILIQRLGFEVMFPAPAGALAVWGLARALKSQRRRDYLLAGAALGLALYTYYSARLLPVAVVVAVAWAAWLARAWRPHLIGLALLTLSACLVFAPLGWFFIQHPNTFFARALTVSTETRSTSGLNLLLKLLENVGRTLAGLSVNGYGDVIPRHNLPGRAAFDAWLSALLWLGVARLALTLRRASTAVLAAWAGAMLLPVALTLTGQSPHFTRLQGAMPALAGVAALGGGWLFDVLARQRRSIAVGVLAFGLSLSALVSAYDYFVRWAADPRLFDAFQLGDWHAATLARDRAQNQIVYLSPDLLSNPAHAVFDLMLSGGPVRDFPGVPCLVYAEHSAQPLTYIVDMLNTPQTLAALHRAFPAGVERETILSENKAWPLYQVFEIPAGAGLPPAAHPVEAQFGEALHLLGYSLSAETLTPGQVITGTFYWQARASLPSEQIIFFHLYTAESEKNGAPSAQNDSAPCSAAYPTPRWKEGEIIVDERALTAPPDFTAGSGVLALGVYEWPSLTRLPLTTAAPQLSDQRLRLITLPVQP